MSRPHNVQPQCVQTAKCPNRKMYPTARGLFFRQMSDREMSKPQKVTTADRRPHREIQPFFSQSKNVNTTNTTPDFRHFRTLPYGFFGGEYLPDSRGTGRTGTDGPSQTKPQDVYFLKLSNQLCPRRAITRSKC